MAKSIHSGHRSRIRARIQKYGINSLEDHEFLEYLLYHTIPRRDTNPIAHKLIDKFGSLEGVLNASLKELREAGLSKRSALWIHCLPHYSEMYQDYYYDVPEPMEDLDSIYDNIEELIESTCRDARVGQMLVISMSPLGMIIGSNLIELTDKEAKDRVRKLCQIIVKTDAYYVVLADVRSFSSTFMSEYDVYMTNIYYRALRAIDVTLFDRYYYSPNLCRSYKKLSLFFATEEEFFSSKYYSLIRRQYENYSL